MYLESYFKDIIDDEQSGSSVLLSKIIRAFVELHKNETVKASVLPGLLDELQEAFPQFAMIQHFLSYLRKAIYGNVFHLEAAVTSYKKKWEHDIEDTADLFDQYLEAYPQRMMVHSNSGFLQSTCKKLQEEGKISELVQSVSWPAAEGVLQARALEEYMNIVIIPDTRIAVEMAKVDILLLGADVIAADYFINKAGSFAACLAAKYYDVPVYVIAGARKRIEEMEIPESVYNALISEHPKPAGELLESPDRIRVENYHYEKIPSGFVTRFF